MKRLFAPITAIFAVFAFCASSCSKDNSVQMITGMQTGDTTVGITAHYVPVNPAGAMFELLFKYNYKLPSPIKTVVRFYIQNKGVKDLPFTIPADNEDPVYEMQGNYLNSWIYPGGQNDSITGVYIPSIIDRSWKIDSVKVIAAATSDKHYGFKVISDADTWPKYFEIKNPVTSIGFKWNGKDFYKEGYDFNAGGSSYNTNTSTYGFWYFDHQFQMFSRVSAFPLKENMPLDISGIMFFDGRQWGAAPDESDGSNSTYSTIQLKITSVDPGHFSGTFSGKLFSNRQPDTLYITDGFIRHAPIPVKE